MKPVISKEIFEMHARLCQAMSHTVRLEIVHTLQDGPKSVTALAQALELNQPTLSRHLAVLRSAGVVAVHRQGSENIYTIIDPKIVTVCNLMRQILADQITHQSEMAKTITMRD